MWRAVVYMVMNFHKVQENYCLVNDPVVGSMKLVVWLVSYCLLRCDAL